MNVFNCTFTVKSIQLKLDICLSEETSVYFELEFNVVPLSRGLILLDLQLQRISYFAYIYKCVLVPY